MRIFKWPITILYHLSHFCSLLPRPYRLTFMMTPLVDLQVRSAMPADLYHLEVLRNHPSSPSRGSTMFVTNQVSSTLATSAPFPTARFFIRHLRDLSSSLFSFSLRRRLSQRRGSPLNLRETHHRVISGGDAIRAPRAVSH